jgi:hypothetical protein
MRKSIFALLALAISLFGTQCWAQCGGELQPPCPPSITKTFSPGITTNTYDFSGTGNGVLTVHFVTVLTMFDLTVTVNPATLPFDPNEFPAGTVAVTYCNGQKDQYDFSGTAVSGGFNGVPVKGKDYQGLIDILLSYFTCQAENYTPAFAHAPGDSTTFTEDILSFYSSTPTCSSAELCDPTMGGKTPGLSTLAAAREALIETDTFCFVSPTEGQTFSAEEVEEIEVAFQLSAGAGGSCPITGQPIRDKTARFSIAMTDSNGNFLSRPVLRDKEEGNKFHWDNKNGLNEFDLSTEGLTPGHYTITLRSTKFSAQNVDIVITP